MVKSRFIRFHIIGKFKSTQDYIQGSLEKHSVYDVRVLEIRMLEANETLVRSIIYSSVLMITASLLQALEKQQESLLHFREAVKLAPWNFEAQKGTVAI